MSLIYLKLLATRLYVEVSNYFVNKKSVVSRTPQIENDFQIVQNRIPTEINQTNKISQLDNENSGIFEKKIIEPISKSNNHYYGFNDMKALLLIIL